VDQDQPKAHPPQHRVRIILAHCIPYASRRTLDTDALDVILSDREKLKLMLDLDDVMYKSNSTSIKDRSTYKNAQKVLVAS
jgi:hypothetical protein